MQPDMKTEQPTAKISDIRIGQRFRKDLGDIDTLAKSIQEIGLIHPIAVTCDLDLVAGRRRLEAWRFFTGARVYPCAIISLMPFLSA